MDFLEEKDELSELELLASKRLKRLDCISNKIKRLELSLKGSESFMILLSNGWEIFWLEDSQRLCVSIEKNISKPIIECKSYIREEVFNRFHIILAEITNIFKGQ